MTTSVSDVDRNAVKAVITSLTHIKEHTTDDETGENITHALQHITEVWPGDTLTVNASHITSDTVETAYRYLNQHAPPLEVRNQYEKHHDGVHPDIVLTYALAHIDTESAAKTGCLPAFRTWNVVYVYENTPIHSRVHDHRSEIEFNPVINGIEYKKLTTETQSTTIRVHVKRV